MSDDPRIEGAPDGYRIKRLIKHDSHGISFEAILERIPKPTGEITLHTRDGRQLLMTICPDFGPRYLYLDPTTRGIPGIAHRSEQIGNFNVVFDYDSDGKLVGIELY